jgi:hypothetical protein
MKWALLALLIFVIFLQYLTLDETRKTRAALAAAQKEQTELTAQFRKIEERLDGITTADQESTLRLRKKLEGIEAKVDALTPPAPVSGFAPRTGRQ